VPTVTALRATRRLGRIAVHVDDSYAFTVSEAFAARHGLFEGRRYDDDEYEALSSQASFDAALAHAYRLLAHRMRSVVEMGRRLREKGLVPQQTDAVLARLTDEGLLDDNAFARAFVADKVRLSGWGRARIVRELNRAGVPDDVVADAVGGLDDETELRRARSALRRRGSPQAPCEQAHRRASDFLTRRGFAPSIVHRAVAEWLDESATSD
jgi:regulatory protein